MLEVLVFLQADLPQLLESFLLTEVLEIEVFASLDVLVVGDDALEGIAPTHPLVHVERYPQLAYLVFEGFHLSFLHG
jgi:hypothetical protein